VAREAPQGGNAAYRAQPRKYRVFDVHRLNSLTISSVQNLVDTASDRHHQPLPRFEGEVVKPEHGRSVLSFESEADTQSAPA
jgi:hypothetical protein